MPQSMDHRGFLAISLTSMASMVNRVLCDKEKTYGFDRNGLAIKMSAIFLLKSAEPLVQLELPVTMEQLAHPQKRGAESYLCRLPLPFALEQSHRVAIARLTAIGAIAPAQWFTTPEPMMVASQCPDGSIQHRFRAHAGSRFHRIVYRFFRQDDIPTPLIMCFLRRRRFLEKRPRTRIFCRGSACRGHFPR